MSPSAARNAPRWRVLAGVVAAGLALFVSARGAPGAAGAAGGPTRIVTLGGSVTETVFALGVGHLVVGVDASSLYPAEVDALPRVGYYRTLSAEGVLSLGPDLILASEGSGPPPALEQLEAAGVRIVWLSEAETPEAAIEKVGVVATELGLEERGRILTEGIRADLRQAEELRGARTSRPRALFVWGRGSGGLTVGGAGSGAAVMLERAGAENAARGISGYQPITAEALVLASPEVLVVPRSTLEGLGGLDALLALPGVGATPAARNRRVVVVDLGAFIGFGPRVGEALLAFTRALHAASGVATP